MVPILIFFLSYRNSILYFLGKNRNVASIHFRSKDKRSPLLNANLLKVVNRSVPSSAVSDGRKKKEALADVVDKVDGKRKKEKKEEKDDKFCKPG